MRSTGKDAESSSCALVVSDIAYTRNLLRSVLHRHRCDAKCVKSASEALTALGDPTLRLMIVDLVAPSGAAEQLLLRARAAGSSLPVVLILVDIERDLLLRLNGLRPVGFVTKPLNVATLYTVVQVALTEPTKLLVESANCARCGKDVALSTTAEGGATETTRTLDAERLRQAFGSLPLLPGVFARIVELSDDEGATAQELAEVIASDPRLCMQILRIVNSAHFGFARRIASISDATVILGVQAIRNLAVGASVADFFGSGGGAVNRAHLWRHSLAVAVAGRMVARRVGEVRAEEAFTAGLLHDFGRLCLEHYMSDAYAEVLDVAVGEACTLSEAEQRVMGVSHAWVSGWLARNWQLPNVLASALENHHRPEAADAEARLLASVVNVADALCNRAGLSGIEGFGASEPSVYGLGLLGQSLGVLETLTAGIVAEAAGIEQQLETLRGA